MHGGDRSVTSGEGDREPLGLAGDNTEDTNPSFLLGGLPG